MMAREPLPGRLVFDSTSSASPPGPFQFNNLLLAGASGPAGLTFRRGGGGSVTNLEETAGGGMKRRLFFSTPEEIMMDDDYYDEQMLPEKKRRLTPEQVLLLERSFEEENKLEPDRKSDLAKKLGLQPRQVAVWFQNRRARWKTKQMERDFDHLKSLYDTLLADHDSLITSHRSVVADNQRLRSEVMSLTEKLQAKNWSASQSPQQLHHHQSSPLLLTDDEVATFESNGLTPALSPYNELKAEDHLSAGHGSVAAADEEQPQLVVESCSSYYPEDVGSFHGGCGYNLPVQSEEEEGSDDGCGGGGYFPGGIHLVDNGGATVGAEEGGNLMMGWWVWP